MKYYPAPDVALIADDLIRQHHPHLIRERLAYRFCDKIPTSKGKAVWASARKVTGLAAALAEREDTEDFFSLVVAYPIWCDMTDTQRRALVDHELCHMWVEEDDEGERHRAIVGHDLEEFAAIVQRYGLWRTDVERFFKAAGQMNLFAEEE